jgi:hypothetical protein
MVHNEPPPIKGKTMKLHETESYMREDDRYERTCYSTYYTTSILDRIKNYLRTFYSPKK